MTHAPTLSPYCDLRCASRCASGEFAGEQGPQHQSAEIPTDARGIRANQGDTGWGERQCGHFVAALSMYSLHLGHCLSGRVEDAGLSMRAGWLGAGGCDGREEVAGCGNAAIPSRMEWDKITVSTIIFPTRLAIASASSLFGASTENSHSSPVSLSAPMTLNVTVAIPSVRITGLSFRLSPPQQHERRQGPEQRIQRKNDDWHSDAPPNRNVGSKTSRANTLHPW